MSDDGARRAPASVSGVSETSSSAPGRSGSALEHALEASSRAGVREQAAQRALGGGNVLYDPLGVFLAGERAVVSVAGSIEDADRDATNADARVSKIIKNPVVVAASAVKHRAIDDVILRECSSARDGVRQVVVINAGFGTRPYRLALPHVTWFEVDLMEVLLLKRHLVRAAGGGEKKNAPMRNKTAPLSLSETPFAHLATPRVRDVKLVGFDAKQEMVAASRVGAAAETDADSTKRATRKPASTPRLAAALEKAGFDASRPCVFVVEDALTALEPWEARFLLRSLPARAAGSTLVIAGIPHRVRRWAERRARATLASAAATADPASLRLAEIASRWRCDLERAAPRKRGLFPFRSGWHRVVSCSLATHARAYGAVADPDGHRADAERVVEFKTKPRGFLLVPGAPGCALFPVKPRTLASVIARACRKTPVLRDVARKLKRRRAEASSLSAISSDDDDDGIFYARRVGPRGPPATSGAFNAAALALVPRARDGGAFEPRADRERDRASSRRGVRGFVARSLNAVFGTGVGRAAVIAVSALAGRAFGDDIAREARLCAAATRRAGRSALDAGRRLRDETIAPIVDETIAPFLNRHVAARLPGDVTFGRGGGGAGKGGGAKASKPRAKPKAKPKKVKVQ